MILVINLNASLDKRYELVDFAKGKVVRAKSVDNTPGGKGIHVANVDTILGEETVVTGFLGGKTGELIAGKLEDYGINGDFVDVAGETRSCLAILTEDGAQTEILEPGPEVSPEELKKFRKKYAELLDKAETVSDVIEIENELTEVRYRIESMQTSLRNWDRRVSWSTVRLTVNEVSEYTPEVQKGYGERLKEALMEGLDNLSWYFIDFVEALPVLAFFLLLLIILILILKRVICSPKRAERRRARKEARAAAKTAKAETVPEIKEESK